MRRRRSTLPARALALLAAWLPLSACGGGQPPEDAAAAGERWNVLLVTLDTTRADRLGCYGYQAARTPRLDALARNGVRFAEVRSTAGVTPMSHASILTGMNPYRHGLRVFHGDLGHRMRGDVTSLAELLRGAGWRTAAFVSAYPASAVFGLDAGFDVYREGRPPSARPLDLTNLPRGDAPWTVARRTRIQRRADDTTDEALAWLGEQDGGAPWFAWVHFFDVHDYSVVPPADWSAKRGVRYDPAVRGGTEFVETRERMYDVELEWMDVQLGRLLGFLQRTGQADRTLIVVTADHGQGLTEGLEHHGWMKHRLLYDWSISVPLIVYLPGGPAGEVVSAPVRTIDVLPTVCEALDLPLPAGVEGLSLLPLVRGEDQPPRVAYAEALNTEDAHSPGLALPERQRDDLFCVVEGRWKLIWHLAHPERSELYDLAADPAELHDVAAGHPAVTERLRGLLERRGATRLAPEPEAGPAPDAGALEGLGYTGEDED